MTYTCWKRLWRTLRKPILISLYLALVSYPHVHPFRKGCGHETNLALELYATIHKIFLQDQISKTNAVHAGRRLCDAIALAAHRFTYYKPTLKKKKEKKRRSFRANKSQRKCTVAVRRSTSHFSGNINCGCYVSDLFIFSTAVRTGCIVGMAVWMHCAVWCNNNKHHKKKKTKVIAFSFWFLAWWMSLRITAICQAPGWGEEIVHPRLCWQNSCHTRG